MPANTETLKVEYSEIERQQTVCDPFGLALCSGHSLSTEMLALASVWIWVWGSYRWTLG